MPGAKENFDALTEHFQDARNAAAFLERVKLKRGTYHFTAGGQLLAASNFRAGPGRTSLPVQCDLFHFEGIAGEGESEKFLIRRVGRMSFHREGKGLTQAEFFHHAAKVVARL